MPCLLCNDINKELKICQNCLDFLKALKCESCKKEISWQEKNFNIYCNTCWITKAQKEQKIKKEIDLVNNKPAHDDKKITDFYDIILKINSIRDILNGWNIEFSENGKNYYEKMKVSDFLKVGVTGLSNKGKTFLFQKLADIELPEGTNIKTEGLSIKCPGINSDNKNIILIDRAGETPLLEKENFNFSQYKDNPLELREHLENLARDKYLTESFLQDIIINESNMLLILIGNLTFQEQKLLNKIRKETKNKKQNLYVIHNLQTFTEKAQVEKYIQEAILKSATFKLKKNKLIFINDKEISTDVNESFFIEDSFDNTKTKLNKVFHLIMAREGTPAGNYYNNFVIKFLRNQMNNFPKQTPFPILKTVKDYFLDSSKDYFEKPLKYNDFEETDDIIKVKKDTKLKFKKVLFDEMGIYNLIGNSYEPKMCYFIYKNRFYFQIELPGKFDKKQFHYNIYQREQYYIFDINATKIIGSKNFFPKDTSDSKFINTREEGPFHLRFNVHGKDFQFKDLKITQVKAPEINVEKKKIDCKITSGKTESKNFEKDKTLELDEVKAEDGVLTFYLELKESKNNEQKLSDSEDDDE